MLARLALPRSLGGILPRLYLISSFCLLGKDDRRMRFLGEDRPFKPTELDAHREVRATCGQGFIDMDFAGRFPGEFGVEPNDFGEICVRRRLNLAVQSPRGSRCDRESKILNVVCRCKEKKK